VQYSFSTNPARTLYRNKIQSWCVSVCVCVCVCLSAMKGVQVSCQQHKKTIGDFVVRQRSFRNDFAQRRHIHGWVFEVWMRGLGLRLMLLPLNHYVCSNKIVDSKICSQVSKSTQQHELIFLAPLTTPKHS
jgi:hypothetical protein